MTRFSIIVNYLIFKMSRKILVVIMYVCTNIKIKNGFLSLETNGLRYIFQTRINIAEDAKILGQSSNYGRFIWFIL